MEKIALVCDSACDLSTDLIEKFNIHMLPLRIIYNNREFLDRVTITPNEVYSNLSKEIPTTSLPSMKDIDALFSKLEKEQYTHVIAIALSSGLSGTFNAINIVSGNYPSMNFHIFDSKTLSRGTGNIVLNCGKLIEEGTCFDDIVKVLPSFRTNIELYYVVDTLEYLKKGGRIGKVAGTIGELLNIKPIISVNNEGVYYTKSKARGKKQALNLMLDLVKEATTISKCKIVILEGGAYEEASTFLERVKALPNIISTSFSDISPALGVHTGPGLIGLCIEKED